MFKNQYSNEWNIITEEKAQFIEFKEKTSEQVDLIPQRNLHQSSIWIVH